MESRRDKYRVKLLGELEVFTTDGDRLPIPADRVMSRLLIAMALRAGQPRRTGDLVQAVWPGEKAFGRDARSLETPASRLRNKLGLPIPPRRGEGYYKLDMNPSDVDALDFIDRVRDDDIDRHQLDELLGMWRGNPQVLYADLDVAEWAQLNRAVEQLLSRLAELSRRELSELKNFRSFNQLFPEHTNSLRPLNAITKRSGRRILIVENEVEIAKTMKAILFEHDCLISTSLEEAMHVLIASIDDLDGAVIDLHLTGRLDSAGLEILSFIRDQRPDLPRLLITASPPAGSQEQMRKMFGLFDILVKGADGYSATGVRDAVTNMLSQEDAHVRQRTLTQFESWSVKTQRALNRRYIAARRAMRGGDEDSYEAIDHWSSLMAQFDAECEAVQAGFKKLPTDRLKRTVDELVDRWALGTDEGVDQREVKWTPGHP
jgi:DNA-binding response OmpR family regulator